MPIAEFHQRRGESERHIRRRLQRNGHLRSQCCCNCLHPSPLQYNWLSLRRGWLRLQCLPPGRAQLLWSGMTVDTNTLAKLGGVEVMGEVLARGMLLAMSI
ncbi:hypothetical protein K432DRAFT_180562 [Lepidopterella palustris CBS 459.81]|uniref:Uncharacterized protein n=1 Tax=Lepidopterella palustris CBS 459.81 TaxID=1314670 RepID=A0A8E2E0V4_9PEZI|nr:hypothetical protein K432DRAFT_180562 [Lepidopterella palustris CBS 459.81]